MTARRLSLVLAALWAVVLVGAAPAPVAAVDEPSYIFVCMDYLSGCTDTRPVRFETYVHDVLPNEWVCSWAADSLRAGSLAVRTYGWWRKAHPRNSTYDIRDDTADQVYKPGSSAGSGSGSCNAAVNDTEGERIEYGGTRIFAAYRAETGNPTADGGKPYLVPAADPHTGSDTTGPGLCQFGSRSYASQGKPYTWITTHYYTGVNLPTGAYVFMSQTHICLNGEYHRIEIWKDPVTETTFSRDYDQGPCPG